MIANHPKRVPGFNPRHVAAAGTAPVKKTAYLGCSLQGGLTGGRRQVDFFVYLLPVRHAVRPGRGYFFRALS
jgi:hypothetical protein